MEKVKRHDWEDALIAAQRDGLIPNGALLVALKLASAITWTPKNGKPSGLYWKNEEALADVGASRATYFRHRKVLFDLGFLTEDKGNLIPQLPAQSQLETARESQLETTESLHETDESQLETEQSQLETQESLGDNPYSVDTYSVEKFSVEESSVEVASATASATTKPVEDFKKAQEDFTSPSFPNGGEAAAVTNPAVSTRDWTYNGVFYWTRAEADAARQRHQTLQRMGDW